MIGMEAVEMTHQLKHNLISSFERSIVARTFVDSPAQQAGIKEGTSSALEWQEYNKP